MSNEMLEITENRIRQNVSRKINLRVILWRSEMPR